MNERPKAKLKRSLGLAAVILYGVGDILGAGIYALVGKIAGIAGSASWLAFGIALVVASLTALSYAELGSRFPRSGGESFFCQHAFRSPSLGLLIGWLVLTSGIVSLATVARAFAGYLLEIFAVSASPTLQFVCMVLFLATLAGINFWGIEQSSKANIVCTMIEATGLLLVITVGIAYLADPAPAQVARVAAEVRWPPWSAIGQGAAIAFFAFIGFEDMVNVSEEMRSPKRDLPVAILTAVAIAGTVYIAVVWVAIKVVPPSELAASAAPLVTVVRYAAPAIPSWVFTAIALFAVSNTALLNFVMASRLLYGMSDQRLVPRWLGEVHRGTNTPSHAIVVVFTAALVLACSGSLVFLAGTTSVLLLTVFLSVNVALVAVKYREPVDHGFRVPILIPIVAAAANAVLVCFVPLKSLFSGSVVIAVGIGILVTKRLRQKDLGDAD